MSVNTPVVNAPYLSVDNLLLTWGSNTTVTMGSGAARDSTNTNDIILNSPVLIDVTKNGLNALDIGTIAASTVYAVFVVGDSNLNHPTGAIVSLSQTAPILPFGYDMVRRVGWITTDNTAVIKLFWEYGSGKEKVYYYEQKLVVLGNGQSTTLAPISLATAVPNIQSIAIINYTFTGASALSILNIGPFGMSNMVFELSNGSTAKYAEFVELPFNLNAGVPSLAYYVTSASDSAQIAVAGYKDFV